MRYTQSSFDVVSSQERFDPRPLRNAVLSLDALDTS